MPDNFTIEDGVLIRYWGMGAHFMDGYAVIPNDVTEIGREAFSNNTILASVVIPDSVTEIGEWAFSGCTSLTSVVIPDSVTKIGDSAFKDCKKLSSVVIPDSVTKIGDSVFKGCARLADEKGFVIIRDVLYSFHGETPSAVIPDSVTKIGGEAFLWCTSLTSVVIPDSVTEIGYSAFKGCEKLSSVVIPDSVTKIGDSAFKGCTSLTSLFIPDSVTGIDYTDGFPNTTVVCGDGSYAHQFCIKHHIFYLFDFQYEAFGGLIPPGIEMLSSPFLADEEQPYVFISYSHKDRDRVLPILKTLYEAGWRIWYDEGLTIGDSYDETLEEHVRNCSAFLLFVTENSLDSLYIEENEVPWAIRFEKPIVKCILDDGKDYEITEGLVIATVSPYEIEPALGKINGLTKGEHREAKGISVAVDPANRSEAAEGDGFAYCLYASQSAATAKAILLEAKNSGCTLYDAVENGADEEELQTAACLIVFLDKAFLSDQALTGLLTEAYQVGRDIAVCRLEDVGSDDYPPELSELDKMHALNFVHGITPDMNKKLTRHLQKRGCRNTAALPGFEYVKTGKGIVIKRYSGMEPNPRIESEYGGIPVVEIGDNAFENCKRLKMLIIPDGVKIIGDSAFKGCTNLSSVSFPNSVSEIDYSAFEGCTNLASVIIPNSVTTIDNYTFKGCSSLSSVVIPDSVTKIGDSAFKGCTSLTSVVIPDSVTVIDDYAFEGCRNLASIVISNSLTDIRRKTFKHCSSLTSVIIPDSVTRIAHSAFESCTSLTSVVIPNSKTQIYYTSGYSWESYAAFRYCNSITVFCPRFSCVWKHCKENKIPVKSIKHAKKQ